MDWQQALVLINAGTLGSLLVFGYRVVRFINRIEFKTDILWQDYEHRMQPEESWDGRERRRHARH